MSIVRQTTDFVARHSRHVSIDDQMLCNELTEHAALYTASNIPPSWAQPYHFYDGTDLTAQYILVLDALNFCFFPLPDYHYHHLASGLKRTVELDRHNLDCEHLCQMTEEELSEWLQPDQPLNPSARLPVTIPLLSERCRLVREVGVVLKEHFGGKAANLIRAAKGSALRLVDSVAAFFPGFRDHCVYKGKQVFLYKRAQIFAADLWGAYKGQGLGAFSDIDSLTCFADYRVPQLLFALGILRYSEELTHQLSDIPAGSEMEVELRALTVQAVERMRRQLAKQGILLASIQLDWILWERGEAQMSSLPAHHRTLTIYY